MSRARHHASRHQARFRPALLALEGRALLNADVLTYHDNNARTSADLSETILTPSTVNAAGFGKLGILAVDGKVDAQPLYMSGLTIPGKGVHNVVFVATEADSVYAFDADNGAVLWHDGPSGGDHPLLGPGETTVPYTDFNCTQIEPTIGITSTPVIDPASGTIYLVAMSKSVVNGTTTYFQRLHALDIATGADRVAPRSIDSTIRFPGKGPGGDGTNVIFDPRMYDERDALTLSNGVIYTAWGSHCDRPPYTGWVIGFRAGDLGLASVLNINPNGTPTSNFAGSSGNSFWNSGAGFAADTAGNLFNISANGPFNAAAGDFGDSYLKLSTTNGLAVADYFTPYNQQALSDIDADLGSSGLLLLPDLQDASGRTVQLAVGSDKIGTIYVVDRNNLGKQGATSNPIHQEIDRALGGGVFGSPAYFNGTVYFGAVGSTLRAFPITNGRLSTAPTSQSPGKFAYPGTSPTVSANGTTGGIVWAAENGAVAALHAYDAADLGRELYNSNQAAGGRDHFGTGNKFITPTVADGKVFVGTTNGVAVFGLLAPTPAPAPLPPPSSPPPTAAGPTVAVPAFASPSPTAGGLILLGALGAEAGLAESGLTYTWSTVDGPSGPPPSFSTNATNASRLVSVNVEQAGPYTFRVAITDQAGRSVTSEVSVVVAEGGPRIVVPAFATPAPVVGGIDLLGVVGSDPSFDESRLTYTWSTLAAPPGAPTPSFSTNATNASRLVSVGVAQAGPYTFRVAITDPAGRSVVSDLGVVVGLPAPVIAVPAFASPRPAVGKVVRLGVVGIDPAFGPSSLTYNWSAIAVPAGAPLPSFGVNRTSASRLIGVSFARPGVYTLRVVVTNPFALSAVSDLTIRVAPKS